MMTDSYTDDRTDDRLIFVRDDTIMKHIYFRNYFKNKVIEKEKMTFHIFQKM